MSSQSSPNIKKEGVDKLYLSVVDKKASQLDKVVDKKEANVEPHLGSTVKYADKKNKNTSKNPYEQTINARIIV